MTSSLLEGSERRSAIEDKEKDSRGLLQPAPRSTSPSSGLHPSRRVDCVVQRHAGYLEEQEDPRLLEDREGHVSYYGF